MRNLSRCKSFYQISFDKMRRTEKNKGSFVMAVGSTKEEMNVDNPEYHHIIPHTKCLERNKVGQGEGVRKATTTKKRSL